MYFYYRSTQKPTLFYAFQYSYLWVFFLTVFTIYWSVLNKRTNAQNLFIVLASYFFYGWWDWRFLGLIIFSSLVDYLVAIQIDQRAEKR